MHCLEVMVRKNTDATKTWLAEVKKPVVKTKTKKE